MSAYIATTGWFLYNIGTFWAYDIMVVTPFVSEDLNSVKFCV